MPNGQCSVCGEWDVDDLHECPPWLKHFKAKIDAEFERLSQNCPWRSYLKCQVLPILASNRYGSCCVENCAFAYWSNVRRSA